MRRQTLVWGVLLALGFYACGGGDVGPMGPGADDAVELGERVQEAIVVFPDGTEDLQRPDGEGVLVPDGDAGQGEDAPVREVEVDIPEPDVAGACDAYPKPFGCACVSSDDCQSGWCVDTDSGRICTQICVDECPPGYGCFGVIGVSGRDITYLCLPRFSKLCQPCREATDCQAKGAIGVTACINYGPEGMFCGGECTSAFDCPGGYDCREVPLPDGTVSRQCVLISGTCQCNQVGKVLGMSTICSVSNQYGTCKGERRCLADGLSPCDAPVPSEEICDLVDNDCNGVVDDIPTNASCLVENEYGSCPGTLTCTGGTELCIGPTPEPENCDGMDNNCNGFTDEGFLDTDKDGKADCIDQDDDGDGVGDETDNCPLVVNPDQTDSDLDGKGDACDEDMDGDGFPNLVDCDPLDPATYPGAQEICDGKDNNCNQQIDEGLCADNFDCTFDYCDPIAKACKHVGDDQKCDDKDPCTRDRCDPERGCVAEPLSGIPCDDGDVCTVGDVCDGGICQGTPNPLCCKGNADCDDNNPCTIDVCILETGQCTHVAVADNTPCDADNDGCTQGDSCMFGVCVAGPPVVCDSGMDPCVTKFCRSTGSHTYICEVVYAPATVPCDDGKFCTVQDHCDGQGNCVGGAPFDCGATPEGCVVAVCSETEKKCIMSPKADGTPCNADDNGCTVGDFCLSGACLPGAMADCEGLGDQCNQGVCESLSSDFYKCTKQPKPLGTPCDDGKYCTVNDECDGNGSCVSGGERDCQEEVGDQCNTGYCDEEIKSCIAVKKPDGTPCDDGNVCTLVDTCQNGLCVGSQDGCVEERINVSGPGAQQPSVGSLGYGRYVTQWTGDGAAQAYLRLSDNTGSRENEEVQLAGSNDYRQWSSPIAVQSSGNFLVLSWAVQPSRIRGWLFKYDGSLMSVKDVRTFGWSGYPSFVRAIPLAFSDGTFGLVDSWHGDPGHLQVRFAPLASDLTPGSTTVLVPASNMKSSEQYDARVVPDGSDTFLVSWVGSDGSKVYVQRFTRTGQKDMVEDVLVVQTNGQQVFATRIAAFVTGQFIVFWEVDGADGSGRGIFGQRFYPDGTKSGQVFRVNQNINGDQRLGDVGVFSDSGFVVTFDDATGDVNGYAVKFVRYNAQGQVQGSEVRVNTSTPGDQIRPTVGVLPGDQFVVAYVDSNKVVWTRRFLKDGSPYMGKVEIRANATTAGSQINPQVAVAQNGNFMVVWESPVFGKEISEVMAAVFTSAGTVVKGEFQVNVYDKDSQNSPVVAGGPDRFIVAWDSVGQDGSVDGIFARLFYSDGTAIGEREFQVNQTTADFQRQPAVGMTQGGQSLVAWNSYSSVPGSQSDIFASIFDKDGNRLSNEFQVNQTLPKGQENPVVAGVPGKTEFLVGWESKDQDGSGYGLYMRKFNVSGQALSDEVQVNMTTNGDQRNLALALSQDGSRVLACWDSYGQDAPNTWGVVCQFFNYPDLSRAGNEFYPHALTAGAQQLPAVAFLPNGEAMVAWASEGVDSSGLGIQVRRLSATGQPYGPRIVANRYWSGNQTKPFIGALSSSFYVVGWESEGQDGHGSGIYFRILPLPQ